MNDNLEEKILNSFSKDMNSELRHKLIKLYNTYKQIDIVQKEPKRNLIEIEESFQNIIIKLNYTNDKLDNDIIEDYIMLSDCIKNYDENDSRTINKTIQLLTKLEILLGLPITYSSQAKKSIDELFDNEIVNKKGEAYFVRRDK